MLKYLKKISDLEARLLVWLSEGDMTFTKLSQKFSNYNVGMDQRSEMIEFLVESGHIEVSTDKDTLNRFSKKGRPRRTLRLTSEGRECIKEALSQED